MDTAPGRRAALTMTGLGSGADAAGLAALHGGVASAAEASLLPPRGNIAERAHRSPEQDTAAPGLQADSIPVYRQRRRADSCGNVQPSLERLHLENTAILSAFTALLSNLVSNVPAVLALKPFVAPLRRPAARLARHRHGFDPSGQLHAARVGGQSDRGPARGDRRHRGQLLEPFPHWRSADDRDDRQRRANPVTN